MVVIGDREFNDNPYYSPEKCGLKQIDEIHGEEDYSFDMVIVWQDLKSKRFYWDSDSGCSCPAPYENVHRLSDLSKLNKTNFYSFKVAVENLYNVDRAEARKLVAKWNRKINK